MELNKQRFFKEVKGSLFRGSFTQDQVDGLDIILNEAMKRGDVNSDELAYILATVFHETAYTMQPIQEDGSQKYLRGKRYWPHIGRGYVQLTWLENYVKAGKKLNVDLVKNPELAMKPEIAVQILFQGMKDGWFTGKSLSTYLDGVEESYQEDLREFSNARRIINGTDKQVKIGKEAIKFYKAILSSEIKNKKPLTQSRTVQGAGGAATLGVGTLVEPVQDVVNVIQGQESSLSSGSVVSIVIGVLIIAASVYALYARWDDAGKPKVF